MSFRSFFEVPIVGDAHGAAEEDVVDGELMFFFLCSSPAPGPSAAPATTPPTPQPQPSIQSVRHIRRLEPYQTSFHTPSANSLSLAAILEQQQTEKNEIHEAATAKHNLQDIQLEQEFQEWWDKESRRVQGLPDPVEPASSTSQKVSNRVSRGGGRNNNNRRRGGGGGGGKSAGGPGGAGGKSSSALTQQLSQQPRENIQQKPQHTNHPDPSGGHARRGGGGGARGRGNKERARV